MGFTIYDAPQDGAAVGAPLTTIGVPVSIGLFSVTLDFGLGVFTGPPRWLGIAVRRNSGIEGFTTLPPRQRMTSVPYTLMAAQAASAGVAGVANSVNATNITGALAAAQLPAIVVTNGARGVDLTGSSNGNAVGLTNMEIGSVVAEGVLAWGSENFGRSTVPREAKNGVVAIAAGASHLLAIKRGSFESAWNAGHTSSWQCAPIGPLAPSQRDHASASPTPHFECADSSGSVGAGMGLNWQYLKSQPQSAQ